MKNLIMKFGGIVAAMALMVTTLNVNTACTFFAYQPKLPDGTDKLRKF